MVLWQYGVTASRHEQMRIPFKPSLGEFTPAKLSQERDEVHITLFDQVTGGQSVHGHE
jgi:hypothetical protein